MQTPDTDVASGLLVAIVEDNPTYRRGVRRLLERTSGICKVCAYRGGEEVVSLLGELQPHVVLLDLHLGGRESLELVARLRASGNNARILILTGEDRPGLAQAVHEAGADGHLPKDAPDTVLVGWVLGRNAD